MADADRRGAATLCQRPPRRLTNRCPICTQKRIDSSMRRHLPSLPSRVDACRRPAPAKLTKVTPECGKSSLGQAFERADRDRKNAKPSQPSQLRGAAFRRLARASFAGFLTHNRANPPIRPKKHAGVRDHCDFNACDCPFLRGDSPLSGAPSRQLGLPREASSERRLDR